MALTSASDIAAATYRRAAAGVRTVKRAVVRRSDAWLYGLNQEYPEYDAYRRRPRRIARGVGLSTRAAKRVATATATLCGALANRWSHRPASDTDSPIPRRHPADPLPRTHLPNSRRSDVSDPPGLVGEPPLVHVESTPAYPPAASGVATSTTTPDTRHTSAIPSTFAPGAA
jgi:hypothetical protein